MKGFFGFVERAVRTLLTNPFLLVGALLFVAALKVFFPGERDGED